MPRAGGPRFCAASALHSSARARAAQA
jgi:hypothetical protein